LRRIAKGERFIFSCRGRQAARLKPVIPPVSRPPADGPFLAIARRATASPKGPARHQDLDRHSLQAGFNVLLKL